MTGAARTANHGTMARPAPLLDQDKGHLKIDAVLRNLSVFHDDLLLLDPRPLDILECLYRAIDAFFDGIAISSAFNI